MYSIKIYWPREVVFKPEHAPEYMEGLLKPWAPPRISDSAGLGQGPTISISSKFSSSAVTTGLENYRPSGKSSNLGLRRTRWQVS